MPLPSTVGQKTEKWWSKFVEQTVSFNCDRHLDDQTLKKKIITRDIKLVIKPKNNFLYLTWRLSSTGLAESSAFFFISEVTLDYTNSYYLKKFGETFFKCREFSGLSLPLH